MFAQTHWLLVLFVYAHLYRGRCPIVLLLYRSGLSGSVSLSVVQVGRNAIRLSCVRGRVVFLFVYVCSVCPPSSVEVLFYHDHLALSLRRTHPSRCNHSVVCKSACHLSGGGGGRGWGYFSVGLVSVCPPSYNVLFYHDHLAENSLVSLLIPIYVSPHVICPGGGEDLLSVVRLSAIFASTFLSRPSSRLSRCTHSVICKSAFVVVCLSAISVSPFLSRPSYAKYAQNSLNSLHSFRCMQVSICHLSGVVEGGIFCASVWSLVVVVVSVVGIGHGRRGGPFVSV